MTSPLNSLKILDFTTLLPGPFATMLLADLGADIIRIESPTRPDLVHAIPPFDEGVSAAHAYLNRSKRSLALDLKNEKAKEVIHKLIQTHDIIIEQFRPGVMQKFGLDYASLANINPALIYCSLTGYGQTGPYKNRAGHDINYLALSSISSYSGRNHEPPPLGIQVADISGSHHAVIGILAAVVHRQQTGIGQAIDISMLDTAFSYQVFANSAYLIGNEIPQTENMLLNGGTFYDYYETQDGRYLSVGSLEPKFLQTLCATLQISQHISLALSQQSVDQQQFKKILQDCFLKKSLQEWMKIFNTVDCCVEPVLNLDEAVQHPQLHARQLVIDVPKNKNSTQQQAACPIKFSKTPPHYKHIGKKIGADTQDILQSLGYSSEEISSFFHLHSK